VAVAICAVLKSLNALSTAALVSGEFKPAIPHFSQRAARFEAGAHRGYPHHLKKHDYPLGQGDNRATPFVAWTAPSALSRIAPSRTLTARARLQRQAAHRISAHLRFEPDTASSYRYPQASRCLKDSIQTILAFMRKRSESRASARRRRRGGRQESNPPTCTAGCARPPSSHRRPTNTSSPMYCNWRAPLSVVT